MNDDRRVVIVDGLQETEEVLRAVLEPRGWEVSRLRSRLPHGGNEIPPPRLVVLHDESDADGGHSPHLAGRDWAGVPTVIIGSAQLPVPECNAADDGRARLSDPFHYAELIQAVDRLLNQKPVTKLEAPSEAKQISSPNRRAA